MYKLVTKYALLGLRNEADLTTHTHHMTLKPIIGAPHQFDTEEAAYEWALSNHDDMRHHKEFVVLPVHHMVMSDPE